MKNGAPAPDGMEIGVFSFAEIPFDPETGRQHDPETRLRHLLEEIRLADEVGLDVFGVGEHHRPDYAVSAPSIVLSAAAARTARIRLLRQHELFGHQRFMIQPTVGPMPHREVLRAIELLGTRVAPVVRRETASSPEGG